MIQYTDIKEAMRVLKNLTTTFNSLKERQEHLRYYIHNGHYTDTDIRYEICDNRLMLGHLQKQIGKTRRNIRRLQQEASKIDFERQVKESLARQLKEE